MRNALILLALLLAACGGPSPSVPPNPMLSLAPQFWVIGPIIDGKSDSPGMPLHPAADGTGWGFDFPPADGVHYITTARTGPMAGTLTATFTVSGAGTIVCSPNGGTSAPKARLYFQKVGDDWSTNGGFRWWSAPSILPDGIHTLSIPLTWGSWTSIYGTTGVTQADFLVALNNVANVGITFGCDFAGHGLYASPQPVHFKMNSYTLGP